MTDAGPQYTLVAPGEGGLGGGLIQTREGMPSYVTVYVAADDLDAKLAEIAVLGGRTVVPPTPIDAQMSFAMFADPQGNMVGLLKTAKASGARGREFLLRLRPAGAPGSAGAAGVPADAPAWAADGPRDPGRLTLAGRLGP